MKRGRILSLFLSIVLLVSAIVPCLQLSVNAAADNAIGEIRTAWGQLQSKEDASTPEVPAELRETDDLLVAISIAEDAIADSAYTDDSKALLKNAVNNAWAIVKGDEELLVKALQNGWNDLVKKEPLDIKYFERYNSSGEQSKYLETWIKDGDADPENLDTSRVGVTDAESSGNTVLLNSNEEQQEKFGNNYVRLTTQKFQDGATELNDNKDNDIPYLDTKHSVVVTQDGDYPIEGLNSLEVTVNSSMAMTLGCSMWYRVKTTKNDGTSSKEGKATSVEEVGIKKGENTIDLMAVIEKMQKELDASTTDGTAKITDVYYVAIGIKSMAAETPDSDDYLEIGNVLSNPFDQCPLTGDVSLATIYNKASSLDFTQYFDNAAKTRFQTLLNDAKTVIRNSLLKRFEVKDELLNVAVNELWPSLTAKELRDIVSFSVYNSSGNRSGGYYDVVSTGSTDKSNADAGISDAANSGVIELLKSSESQQANFGNNYVRLTTSRFSSGDSLNEDKTNDIPYLSTKSVVLTPTIDYPTSNLKSLTVTVNSSMAMNVGYRIWVGIKDKPEKENATTSIVWAVTGMNEAKIKEGINTIEIGRAHV